MSPPSAPRSSRHAAAATVAAWLRTERFPSRLMEGLDRDRPFVEEVVLGVARWRGLLDWVISRHAHRPADAPVRALLLVGVYQLLRMDSVPPYAAVSETVQAARTMAPHAAGFVNAVLRGVLREMAALRSEIERQPLETRCSHPPVLIERWRRAYGEARTEALCAWNNRAADVVAVLDTRRVTAAAFLDRLSQAGLRAEPHPFAPDRAFVFPRGIAAPAVPGFEEGWFTVRDPSTECAVDLLEPRPGDRVLDACAAPGGKTVLLAQRMEDRGTIVAMDRAPRRLRRLEENIGRMGLSSVRAVAGDAASASDVEAAAGGELFDRILLDVPCTNTGVLRRRPDARWRFNDESLRAAVELQHRLLACCARFLKPGGRLVYSTCSLEPEEGEETVAAWLAATPGARLIAATRLVPPESDADGIYAAAIEV